MTADRPLPARGPALAKPPSGRLVLGSLAMAFLVGLLPWPAEQLWWVPDFTLIVLIYWNVHAPRMAHLGVAFTLGLLTDAHQGVLFGLHALVYTIVAFLALSLRRRLENFPPRGQAPQVAPLLVGKEALMVLLSVLLGSGMSNWWVLLAGLTGTLVWLPVSLLLDKLSGRSALTQGTAGGDA